MKNGDFLQRLHVSSARGEGHPGLHFQVHRPVAQDKVKDRVVAEVGRWKI